MTENEVGKKFENMDSSIEVTSSDPKMYRTYVTRWLVMFCAIMLNMTGHMVTVSYGPIAPQAAEYFEVDGNMIDLLILLGMAINFIGLFVAIYSLDRWGVLFGLRWGGTFLLVGTTTRMLATFPSYEEHINPNTRFWIGFIGNAIVSFGIPIILTISTKISQVWFGDRERMWTTAAMSMSLPLGAMIGSLLSSQIVQSAADIPKLNVIYPCLTLVGFSIAWLLLRSGWPPSPPSPSAENLRYKHTVNLRDLLKSMKKVLRSKTILVYLNCFGMGGGLTNTITSQIGQMLCVQGYPSSTAGLAAALLILSGLAGAFILGPLGRRFGQQAHLSVVTFLLACVAVEFLCLSLRQPDMEWAIYTTLAIYGVLGFGGYPLVLELAAEETYPTDPVISEGLIHGVAQIQGVILVSLGNWSVFHWPVTSEIEAIQVCKKPGETGGIEPHDYTPFYYLLMIISGFNAALFAIFARPTLRRSEFDRKNNEKETLE